MSCDLSSAILSVSFETSEKGNFINLLSKHQSLHLTIIMILNASCFFRVAIPQIDVLIAILLGVLQIRVEHILKLFPQLFHVHFPFFCDRFQLQYHL
jgi:hypothetical protein